MASILKIKNKNNEWISIPALKGEPGISISKAEIDKDGYLIINFSNGDTINVGKVVGAAGEPGKAFTYEDFTPEQLLALKGEPGLKGDDGTSITITDIVTVNDDGVPVRIDIDFSDGSYLAIPIIHGEDGNTPYINDNGNWQIGNIDTGVKAKGESCIYIGSDEPPEDIDLQIDPEGEALGIDDLATKEYVDGAIANALSTIGIAEEGAY